MTLRVHRPALALPMILASAGVCRAQTLVVNGPDRAMHNIHAALSVCILMILVGVGAMVVSRVWKPRTLTMVDLLAPNAVGFGIVFGMLSAYMVKMADVGLGHAVATMF